MTGRRYVARHLRRTRPAERTVEDQMAEHQRLWAEARDLHFRFTLMPDGLDKIRAGLVCMELYIRAESVAVEVDYRLARLGRVK